jgi:hypothetical protein
MVCLYSLCSAAAGSDVKLSPAERSKQRDQYADQSIEYLRQAVAKGFRDLPTINNDTDLDAVRGHPDFKKSVAEAEKKIKGEK